MRSPKDALDPLQLTCAHCNNYNDVKMQSDEAQDDLIDSFTDLTDKEELQVI